MLTACGDENVVTADTSTADTSTADTTVEDTGPADPCDGKADGESCDDGDPCTLDDVCSAGACVGGSNDPCESDSTCQTGTCVPGEGCKYENADDGTECSVTCFEEATCIAGECKANADTAVVCASPEEAGNPCLEELQCEGRVLWGIGHEAPLLRCHLLRLKSEVRLHAPFLTVLRIR